MKEEILSKYISIKEKARGDFTILFNERIDGTNANNILEKLYSTINFKSIHSISVDMSNVKHLDDYGATLLFNLKNTVEKQDARFDIINIPEKIEEILHIFKFHSLIEEVPIEKKPHPDIFTRIGEGTLKIIDDTRYMISFIGSIIINTIYVIRHPRALRVDDTILCMQRTGVDALPIVGLISFLMGLIMAFMSSVQLEQFGANIYVASLVSLAMTRELGPIMTAIIVAGRSGSAFAAEIGTMKISEEIDALYTMGFDPTRFLVIPKLVASVIVVPILTLFSDLFAIVGGLLVGIGMLDLTANAYIAQTIKTIGIFDVSWGFMKSAVFAILIAWIGCFRGFRVTGGAAGVGQATTSAVVSSIFLIILTDSIFSVILRYWG